METLDSLNLQDSSKEHELVITTIAQNYLRETAKWARFLAIIGFVFIGIMVIAAFAIGSIFAFLGKAGNNPALSAMGAGTGGALTIAYLLFALLYFFPTLYLFQFASKTLTALKTNNQQLITEAFGKHKSVYKFMGIMTAIVLGFYAFALLIGILVAVLAR